VATVEELKTVPIVAVTPEEKEVPVAEVIQTTPVVDVATAPSDRELPKSASSLSLIAGLGLGSLALAFALMMIGKRATV
jgi:hypothetical protein